jgi:hypothetical protein
MSNSPPASEVAAPTDARGGPRKIVRRCGWFVGAVGEQLRECTVWDESEAGARLVVDSPDTFPDAFHIYMTLDFTSRRQCRVVWRRGNQIGVEFQR